MGGNEVPAGPHTSQSCMWWWVIALIVVQHVRKLLVASLAAEVSACAISLVWQLGKS